MDHNLEYGNEQFQLGTVTFKTFKILFIAQV